MKELKQIGFWSKKVIVCKHYEKLLKISLLMKKGENCCIINQKGRVFCTIYFELIRKSLFAFVRGISPLSSLWELSSWEWTLEGFVSGFTYFWLFCPLSWVAFFIVLLLFGSKGTGLFVFYCGEKHFCEASLFIGIDIWLFLTLFSWEY